MSSSSSGSLSTSSSLSVSSSSSQVAPDLHGVKLRKLVQTKYVINNVDGFRMKIEAYDANRMSNAIFRYLRGPMGAHSPIYPDDFDGVCSPSDLEEFQEEEPYAGANPAWFRLSTVDLVFRSQTTADEAWDMIVKDVSVLVSTLDIMDSIQPEKVVVIGSPLN